MAAPTSNAAAGQQSPPRLQRQPSMEEERMAFRHLASPATNVFVNHTWRLSALAIVE